ncbi:unnamed protein product [Linum trigynum]|uniref:F-box domain-containing protein n=1 Tax=Linum trigynum TaxID=586398 RepID=A0AAV2GIB1_9ROSI
MTTTINKLGDDLVVEILIRSFPNPKPACRCKLVCKRWRSLISDPILFSRRFASYHKSINEKVEPPLLVTSSSSIFRHQSLNFLPVPDKVGPYFTIFDSFQDLLLCGFSVCRFRESEEFERFYFVCNPFTKQWVALPLAPESSSGILITAARLVCEPVHSTSLDLGEGGAAFDYSSYRFRVVLRCEPSGDERLYVFCFESGEWTEETLVLENNMLKSMVSCGGKLFFHLNDGAFRSRGDGALAFRSLVLDEFDPFRLDHAHPRRVHTSIALPVGARYRISVLQGALHMVLLESKISHYSRNALTVWRLEEDDDDGDVCSWRKLHEVLLKETMLVHGCNYELDRLFWVYLHPRRPEIVFLNYLDYRIEKKFVLSMDLTGTKEVEFFDTDGRFTWNVFQPKISCWPTPIPKYEELRGTYGEIYDYLLKIKNSTNISQ